MTKALCLSMYGLSMYVSLCWVLVASSAEAQSVLNIRFDQDNFATHFDRIGTGVALDTSPAMNKCLAINRVAGTLALKPIRIEPLQKYKLTISAAVDSEDTIENNDRLPEIALKTYGKACSGYALHFFDADGEEVAFRLYKTVLIRPSGEFISSQVHDHVVVFFAPPRASTLRLTLRSRKNRLMIERVKLKLDTTEGTINCNPNFRYGELNPSGWVPHSEGRLYRRPDGTTVLKSGPGSRSGFFPVDDQARYSFYCKGTDYETKKGKATVTFYDGQGNSLSTTHLFWGKDMQQGATKQHIMPPPGAVQAMLHAALVILEEIRVTKDK